MSNNKNINNLKAFLLISISLAVWWVISIIVDPSNRIGPFGLGITSPMREYTFEQQALAINYPEGWNILLTPQGNHGDMEVIAVFVIPWHSLPNVEIMEKPFTEDEVSLVAVWGEKRLQSNASYQSISLTPYNSEHFSGLLREYSETSKSIFSVEEIHCLDLNILHSHVGYIFSFCASQNDWQEVIGTFNEMIASIRPLE